MIVTLGLFLFDYDREYGFSFTGKNFLGNALQAVTHRSHVREDLFDATSLKGANIISLPSLETFFDTYLLLPKGASALRFQIADSSIQISELRSGQAFRVIDELSKQEGSTYSINRINQSTFYLNQIPLEEKTHNFLGIIIQQVLYGFQYRPSEHLKVLEIIDALSAIQ